MIIAPFTFTETEEEVPWFTAGWDTRVLTGSGKGGCPDRDDHPGDRGLQGTQVQRVSWQRGWDAADAVCHAIGSGLEIRNPTEDDLKTSVLGTDVDFVDPNRMVKLPENALKHLVSQVVSVDSEEKESAELEVEFSYRENGEVVIRLR